MRVTFWRNRTPERLAIVRCAFQLTAIWLGPLLIIVERKVRRARP
jgi:hypothetical protein